MDYLVFQLYGPLASWGETAIGESRPTGFHPSRSALLGLLAACLGIPRDQQEQHDQLRESLGVAVKTYLRGGLMRDYHTAEAPSQDRKRTFYTRKDELSAAKLNTILSTRDYRSDGYWVVAVWCKKDNFISLERLKEKLEQPVFIPYLGRKACPLAAPFFPQQITGTLKEALDTPFPALIPYGQTTWLKPADYLTYSWEGKASDLTGELNEVQSTSVWDEPISRTPWQFASRQEHQYIEKGGHHVSDQGQA
ncbi:type I-E CRISPR-associated protein Cas5/CasD [Marinospirillum sp.]|uniref:type I-E CRISPR-associated protein Cas5/CasD n=1 Tax=Marinospirillum sp. TaxID=2183934 RepID=UPI003850B050